MSLQYPLSIAVNYTNFMYICCWKNCKMGSTAYDEFISHWINKHYLSEQSLSDIRLQIDVVMNFEKAVNREKQKFNISTAYTYKHMPNLNSMWANNQIRYIEVLEMDWHYQKKILLTMLTHIHFWPCIINTHYSSLLSIPRIKV